MSDIPITTLLQSLNTAKDRTFKTRGDELIQIATPVVSKRSVEQYATTLTEIATNQDKIKIPIPLQLAQNIARTSLIYAASVTLKKDDPYHAEMNKLRDMRKAAITDIVKSKKINDKQAAAAAVRKEKSIVASINQRWAERFDETNPNNIRLETMRYAYGIAQKAIEEICANESELSQKYNPKQAMTECAVTYIDSYTKIIVKDNDHRVANEPLILSNYRSHPDLQSQFLYELYGSNDQRVILKELLVDNASILDGESINCDSKLLADKVMASMSGDKSTKIVYQDIKKCALNGKTNQTKGNISANYISDKEYPNILSLMVTVHKFGRDGQSTYDNHYINWHKEDCTNPSSPIRLNNFIETGEIPKAIKTTQDIEARKERELNNLQETIKGHNQQLIEDRSKRSESINQYQQKTPINSKSQLEGTYFSKKGKGLEDIVAKYSAGLRIDEKANIWVPLSTRIGDADINNTRGFQELLPKKVVLNPAMPDKLSNKKYSMARGDKSNCFYTIGDPNKASAFIVSEGIANGFITHALANEAGIDICLVNALDVGNLNNAIREIIIQHPTKPIINFADNDMFSKKGEVRKTLETAQGSPSTYNVGETKAVELQRAIGLPYIKVNFDDVNGESYLEEQKQNKYSDIDDLIEAIMNRNISKGVDKAEAMEDAKGKAKKWLLDNLVSTLKKEVSVNWTIDTQHEHSWCGSTTAMNGAGLDNYHFLKEPVEASQLLMNQNKPTEMKQFSYEYGDNLFSPLDDVFLRLNENNEVYMNHKAGNIPEQPKKQAQDINSDPSETHAIQEDVPVQVHNEIEPILEQSKEIAERIDAISLEIYETNEKLDDIVPDESDLKAKLFEKQEAKLAKLQGELDSLEEKRLALQKHTNTDLHQSSEIEDNIQEDQPEIKENTEPVLETEAPTIEAEPVLEAKAPTIEAEPVLEAKAPTIKAEPVLQRISIPQSLLNKSDNSEPTEDQLDAFYDYAEKQVVELIYYASNSSLYNQALSNTNETLEIYNDIKKALKKLGIPENEFSSEMEEVNAQGYITDSLSRLIDLQIVNGSSEQELGNIISSQIKGTEAEIITATKTASKALNIIAEKMVGEANEQYKENPQDRPKLTLSLKQSLKELSTELKGSYPEKYLPRKVMNSIEDSNNSIYINTAIHELEQSEVIGLENGMKYRDLIDAKEAALNLSEKIEIQKVDAEITTETSLDDLMKKTFDEPVLKSKVTDSDVEAETVNEPVAPAVEAEPVNEPVAPAVEAEPVSEPGPTLETEKIITLNTLNLIAQMQRNMSDMSKNIMNQNEQLHQVIKTQSDLIKDMRTEMRAMKLEMVALKKEATITQMNKLKSDGYSINKNHTIEKEEYENFSFNVKTNADHPFYLGEESMLNRVNKAKNEELKDKSIKLSELTKELNEISQKVEQKESGLVNTPFINKQSAADLKSTLSPTKNVDQKSRYLDNVALVKEHQSIEANNELKFKDLDDKIKIAIIGIIHHHLGKDIDKNNLMTHPHHIEAAMRQAILDTNIRRGVALGAVIASATTNCPQDFSQKAVADFTLLQLASINTPETELAATLVKEEIDLAEYYSKSKDILAGRFELAFANEVDLIAQQNMNQNTQSISTERDAPKI